MSGNSIVVDTSVIINFFNGKSDVKELVTNRNLFVSVITEIELLSFHSLSVNDKQILKQFLSECCIIDIEHEIKELTITIRSQNKIKLPDAVIAATAIYFDLPLLTMDNGYKKIAALNAMVIPV